MPSPGLAIGGLLSAGSSLVQAKAANNAADAQSASAAAGIAEQRRQFDTVRRLLDPFVDVGRMGLNRQAASLGLRGPQAQQRFVNAVRSGPQFQEMVQQGENAILQNASATGGLRGGNTQGALAQFRPQVLNQLLEQQYAKFGGLAAMGQSAAAGVGSAAQTTGANVSGLLQQQGAAQAGSSLATGNAIAGSLGQFGGLLGRFGGIQSDGTMNVGQSGALFGGNSWGF